MSKFSCITDLIWFMMKEVENLMKGFVHEEDFFIVHDALVLMTAKETIELDEREQLLPSLVASHEWIAGQDTLLWAPCR